MSCSNVESHGAETSPAPVLRKSRTSEPIQVEESDGITPVFLACVTCGGMHSPNAFPSLDADSEYLFNAFFLLGVGCFHPLDEDGVLNPLTAGYRPVS